jgi:hypothetical protein
MLMADVGFAQHIRPLFNDRNIGSMSSHFDLSPYDDVRANADSISGRVTDGTMPCCGAWPDKNLRRFRDRIEGGFAQ